MSAFVQINLEFWTAWEMGELSNEERDLGLYIAFKTDFRTGLLRTTLETIAADLGWHVPRSTVTRRLARLCELGFLQADVRGRGRARFHVLYPANSLLRIGHVAQQSATKRATNEAAPGAGLDGEPAAIDATTEEKRRDKNLSTPTAQVVPTFGGNDVSAERATSNGNGRGPGWVDNLSMYTGCKYVRGTHAFSAKYDPLGTERPPSDWPHQRPTRAEVRAALDARGAVST